MEVGEKSVYERVLLGFAYSMLGDWGMSWLAKEQLATWRRQVGWTHPLHVPVHPVALREGVG